MKNPQLSTQDLRIVRLALEYYVDIGAPEVDCDTFGMDEDAYYETIENLRNRLNIHLVRETS